MNIPFKSNQSIYIMCNKQKKQYVMMNRNEYMMMFDDMMSILAFEESNYD